MKYRNFSNTGWKVSELGLGCWGLGGSWTDITKKNALLILDKSLEKGVNFFDTSDAYGHGVSEQIIGNFLKKKNRKVIVATKIGTKLKPFFLENYNQKYLEKYIDNSLKNLKVDCIDLLQLHCPPIQVLQNYELYNIMEKFKKKGKIKFFGVSVFSTKEAKEVLNFDNVSSIQVVFNIFRQKPLQDIFKKAYKKKIAVIARGPFASGLLTGSINSKTIFPSSDHRNYNRFGKYFNISETFSGIPMKNAQNALKKLKEILPDNISLIELSLNWILQHKEVTTVIPGATHPLQIDLNYTKKKIRNLKSLNIQIENIYNKYIKFHDDKVS